MLYFPRLVTCNDGRSEEPTTLLDHVFFLSENVSQILCTYHFGVLSKLCMSSLFQISCKLFFTKLLALL